MIDQFRFAKKFKLSLSDFDGRINGISVEKGVTLYSNKTNSNIIHRLGIIEKVASYFG